MSRKKCEYDLFIPLRTADGRVKVSVLQEIKSSLVAQFGGVTEFRHRNKGIWKSGNSIYRDDILLLRVLSADGSKAKRWMKEFKNHLEKSLKQKELLVVQRQVETI